MDHNCSTSVKGLYACGEAAGGIHGADRLGGMASGSCLVFGTLAAESASSYASEISHISVTLTQAGTQMKEAYAACRPFGTDRNRHTPPIPASLSQPPAVFICRRVRELMWQHAGILRSMENLKIHWMKSTPLPSLQIHAAGQTPVPAPGSFSPS